MMISQMSPRTSLPSKPSVKDQESYLDQLMFNAFHVTTNVQLVWKNNENKVLSTSNLKKNALKVSSNFKSTSKKLNERKFVTRDSSPDACIILD